jgi:hypothetical protein
VRRVGLGKGQKLFRVAFGLPNYFMMSLWGTLALQSSMAALLAPESKCLLTTGIKKVVVQITKTTFFKF